MKGKIWGIMVSVLGIGGLILALVYMNAPASGDHAVMLIAGGLTGAVAFFVGIWLTDYKGVKVSAVKSRLLSKAGIMSDWVLLPKAESKPNFVLMNAHPRSSMFTPKAGFRSDSELIPEQENA